MIGAEPGHGPFNGGGTVLVHGKGFTSQARIWFGGVEVDETTTVPIDPTKVQVVAPPGTARPVDLTVQNGSDTSTKPHPPRRLHLRRALRRAPAGPSRAGR